MLLVHDICRSDIDSIGKLNEKSDAIDDKDIIKKNEGYLGVDEKDFSIKKSNVCLRLSNAADNKEQSTRRT